MRRTSFSFLLRLSGGLLIALALQANAEEVLTLTAAQAKALNLSRQTLTASRDGAGSTLPAKVVVPTAQMRIVAAPVGGMVEQLAVAPGSTVRRGEVLARIASPEALMLQRDALQASSQSALLQESLRRDETLFKEGLIAESRLQSTRAAAAQAAAQAGERRQGLALAGVAPGHVGGPLTLVAPIDGVILEQGVQLGQRVEAAALIYRVARLTPLWLEAQLPVTRLDEVRTGQSLKIAGNNLEGKVIAVGRAVDPASQSVLLRAAVDKDAGRLVPGQMVEVALAGSTGAGAGLRLPAGALVRHEGQTLVFVLLDSGERGDRYAARPVRVVSQGGDGVLVDGLKAGDTVVISGTSGLKAMLAGVGKS